MANRSLTLRKECLQKADNKCANCDQDAHHAHHIVPLVLGGQDRLSNLVALCEECHEKVHGIKLKNHSELTKEGLKKARQRGVKLGGLRGHRFGGLGAHLASLNQKRKDQVREEAHDLAPILLPLRSQGLSYRSIASLLNDMGVKTRLGKDFYAVKVSRLLEVLNEFTTSGPG